MPRNSTPSWLLPSPVRRFREHLREIRSLASQTQHQGLETRAILIDELAQLQALAREQLVSLSRIESRLAPPARFVPWTPPAGTRLPGAADPEGPIPETTSPHPADFDYHTAVATLVDAGVSQEAISWGSITRDSLEFIRETIHRELSPPRPPIALHVGNFLGVSLAGVAAAVRDVHPDALTIAVDPAVTAGGIAHPQDHVVQLLDVFGLSTSVLLICGYSFGRTNPDSLDAVYVPPGAPLDWPSSSPPPAPDVEPPPSGEQVLPLLSRLGVSYDLALLDGNHGGQTVAAELHYLTVTMHPGGLVFLDDAFDPSWPEISELFHNPGDAFEYVGQDGRVGVLRRVS